MSVPALRFKEFEESWKKRPLSQIVGRLESGVSVNSLDEPITSSHDYGILKTSCISNGSFNAQENKKIIEEDITRAKLNPAKDSILVSRMNTPQLVGEVGYISCDYPNLFIPDRLWLIQTRDKLIDSAKWLNYQLTTPKLKNALTSIATGTSGSMKNIAQPSFLNLEVHTPALQEQAKIANFLSAVDEKISLLTQKHDLLTQYKKGVMQQIFSQELRFKDDDGGDFPEWEEKLLGEVFKDFKGSGLSKDKIGEVGKNKCILYGHLFTKYSEVITKIDSWTDFDEGLLSKEGDILMPSSTTTKGIDLAKASSLNQSGVLLGGDIIVLRLKGNGNSSFFAYLLTHAKAKEIAQITQGITIIHLYFSQLKNIFLDYPCEKEQTKIANFLIAIDDKITQTQAELDAVKQYKQGLLQQMFV